MTAPASARLNTTPTGADAILRIGAWTLIAAGLLRLSVVVSFSEIHNDFSHYYLGGIILSEGLNPYTEHLQSHCERFGFPYDDTIPYAAHPPMILRLFSALTVFSPATAYTIWLVIQTVCFVAFVELTRRILDVRWNDLSWLGLIALFTNSVCAHTLFHYSQIQLVVGVLILGAYRLHQSRYGKSACALIALAACFKIFPAMLLPWFVFAGTYSKRQWFDRIVIVTGVIMAAIQMTGPELWSNFLSEGLPSLTEKAEKWCNFSVQNLVLFIGNGTSLQLFNSHAAKLASIVVAIGAYALAYRTRSSTQTSFSIVLSAMVVGGVIAWSHYYTLLLLPIALLWQQTAENRNFRSIAILCSALALMPKLDLVIPQHDTLWRVLVHFYPLYCVLLIITALAFLPPKAHPDAGKRLNGPTTLQ